MLAAPKRQLVCDGAQQSTPRYALVAHDWCGLNYAKHRSKCDTTQLSHEYDVGYELRASLLIDAANGQPVTPIGLNPGAGRTGGTGRKTGISVCW